VDFKFQWKKSGHYTVYTKFLNSKEFLISITAIETDLPIPRIDPNTNIGESLTVFSLDPKITVLLQKWGYRNIL